MVGGERVGVDVAEAGAGDCFGDAEWGDGPGVGMLCVVIVAGDYDKGVVGRLDGRVNVEHKI